MVRLYLILGIIVIVAMLYAWVDLAMIERSRVRGVNKLGWAAIILLPVLGAILWFAVGRERGGRRPQPRVIAPDDDPNFLKRVNTDTDERIRRLEQELADLDDDPPVTKE